MQTNVALAGGGTAGHITPNLALLPELKTRFDKIIYLGAPSSMEEALCKKANLPFYPTETSKFHRKRIWKNAALPLTLIKGIRQAKSVLKAENVSVVFSKGGYAAIPTVLAARSIGIPIVCHESDCTMGLANRLTALFAAKIYTAFPGTYKKASVLATPIREEIFRGEPLDLFSRPEKPVVLFMGGSLGAAAINDALSKSFAELTEKYNILHISGKSAPPIKSPSYVSVPFTDSIEDFYKTADVVVCRAGASTLGELTALGKKVVAVPLPKGESRGDQEENAAYYLSEKKIRVLPQSELSARSLLAAIDKSIKNSAPAPAYDRNTPSILAEALYAAAKSRGAP